ncbi:MAG: hypothetical protein U0Y68_21725 [Blastocatellia bacterium]
MAIPASTLMTPEPGSDVVEVVAFGNHLRADHQTDMAISEFEQQAFKGSATARGVAVARDAQFGIEFASRASICSVPSPT